MKILVAHNWSYWNSRPVETYARSMIRDLQYRDHEVFETVKATPKSDKMYKEIDLLLDIDCGRDANGNLNWHGQDKKPNVLSAVYFIDSHGYPSLHKRIAKNYDHVFFAVWDKRDLFAGHPSAHWCPNFTDLVWFDGADYPEEGTIDFGFFGSKGGLGRAKPLIEITSANGWTHDVRQVNRGERHRWPDTARAMSVCRNLFNKAQKHDGPNLRVFESMCINRPLICDQDQRSGLDKLFQPWVHYIPYNYDYTNLEGAMKWCMNNSGDAKAIANAAYNEVKSKHLVKHRMDFMLEVIF